MEARKTLNTQLSLAVGPSRPLPRSEAQTTKRALCLELSLGQGSGDENAGERKKPRLSKEQAAVLEANFDQQPNPDTGRKTELADMLGLYPRQVEVWFQNRRARTKSKKRETECGRLKQECENLIEENRKLREEAEMWKAVAAGEIGPFSAGGLPGYALVCSVCHQVFFLESGTAAV